MILSNEYDRLIVENTETGEEIAVIDKDKVITADDKIVVRLKPRTDIPKKHKYRIETDGKSTKVFLNDTPISYIRSCEFSHFVGQKPRLSLNLLGHPDITSDDRNE